MTLDELPDGVWTPIMTIYSKRWASRHEWLIDACAAQFECARRAGAIATAQRRMAPDRFVLLAQPVPQHLRARFVV